MITVRNALAVLAHDSSVVASNYREIQNANGAGRDPLPPVIVSAKTKLSSIVNTDIVELRAKFANTKRILKENDSQAALLFEYMEKGLIDQNMNFVDVPLLDQTDYGNIRYSAGTIATSGCGLTSLCMIASYFLGQLVTPDQMAGIASENRESNVGRMTHAADYLGLNWYNDPSTSPEKLKQYLAAGNYVICLVKSSSHFVLCKGVTDDGRILVNDPYGPWQKDQALTLGELQMSAGNTWIFDPNQNRSGNSGNAGNPAVNTSVLQQINASNNGIDIYNLPADTGATATPSASAPPTVTLLGNTKYRVDTSQTQTQTQTQAQTTTSANSSVFNVNGTNLTTSPNTTTTVTTQSAPTAGANSGSYTQQNTYSGESYSGGSYSSGSYSSGSYSAPSTPSTGHSGTKPNIPNIKPVEISLSNPQPLRPQQQLVVQQPVVQQPQNPPYVPPVEFAPTETPTTPV